MQTLSTLSRVSLALGLALPLLVQMDTAGAIRSDGVQPGAPAMTPPKVEDGAHAFDFLIGDWTVVHRRRTQILKSADTWSEFDGTLQARPIWDGRGHIDEFLGNSPAGLIEGMSLRLYDPGSNQWRDGSTRRAPMDEQNGGQTDDHFGNRFSDERLLRHR